MLEPLKDTDEDAARLWAEIHTLRSKLTPPDGYVSWENLAVELALKVKKHAETICNLRDVILENHQWHIDYDDVDGYIYSNLYYANLDNINSVTCRIPPDGWFCSRIAGHSGPCAESKI